MSGPSPRLSPPPASFAGNSLVEVGTTEEPREDARESSEEPRSFGTGAGGANFAKVAKVAAVETIAVLSSVETYLRITDRDGWSVAKYRKWLRRMLAENVFIPPPTA